MRSSVSVTSDRLFAAQGEGLYILGHVGAMAVDCAAPDTSDSGQWMSLPAMHLLCCLPHPGSPTSACPLVLQPTVVREFHLSTSKRAEWDASRSSEEARLTTEERAARQVGGGGRDRLEASHCTDALSTWAVACMGRA